MDVDVDSPEALAVVDALLPITRLIHGRPSKPRSHWWYMANKIAGNARFRAPDGTCLVEVRSTGMQTIVPPSVHPSGEVLAWDSFGPPMVISGPKLREAVARVAACSLLVRCWPPEGSRHDTALASGGLLLQEGVPEELAVKLVEVAARTAGDEEWESRGQDVRDTARNLTAGKAVTSGRMLARLLHEGDAVVAKLRDWLRLSQVEAASMEWELPLPFADVAGPPFPNDVFPKEIGEFVERQAVALQTPLDLVGCLVLGTGAAASAGRCIIRLNPEWTEPVNLFVVVALPSGERKSPSFRAVTAPLEEKEQELALAAEPEIASVRTRADILARRLQEAKAQAARAKDDKNRERMANEAVQLAKELTALSVPVAPRLVADDATSEAVASLLAQQGGAYSSHVHGRGAL